MQPPQCVVFDLGKVLLDFDYQIAANRLARCCRVTATEIYRIINQSTLLHRYESGLLTTGQMFEEFQLLTGYQASMEEFAVAFGDIFTPIAPMIALHAELRQRDLPTYIFSNTNELAVRHIRSQYPFFGEFSGYVYSFEQRAMKPEAPIYEAVERLSGCSGSAILYVDDRAENFQAGIQRGWQAILHESPESTRLHFDVLGLL